LEVGSWRCSTESQVTGDHIGPAVDYNIRTICQRNRIAANGVPAGLTDLIERKMLPVKSLVLTMSSGGKPPGNTSSAPFTGTPAGDQFADADQ